jgi:hypothetical protein
MKFEDETRRRKLIEHDLVVAKLGQQRMMELRASW